MISTPPLLVSVHGGHSGQFCNHAQDSLEGVVQTYIARGFAWVGITEHMPPVADQFLYPEEREADLTARRMGSRFADYISEIRRLQDAYRKQIEIFAGFETEAYSGSLPHIRQLLDKYHPDYIVGSLHHVNDIPFDYSAAEYARAVAHAGGLEPLYCSYFDAQYNLIRSLQPAVVGHFDLIRLFDPDYNQRLQLPAVAQRIKRNLRLIRDLDLILDFNVAALRKGAPEPYVSHHILSQARDLGIAVVPGDDAHGVDSVGDRLDQGIRLLQQMGFNTDWRKPARL